MAKRQNSNSKSGIRGTATKQAKTKPARQPGANGHRRLRAWWELEDLLTRAVGAVMALESVVVSIRSSDRMTDDWRRLETALKEIIKQAEAQGETLRAMTYVNEVCKRDDDE